MFRTKISRRRRLSGEEGKNNNLPFLAGSLYPCTTAFRFYSHRTGFSTWQSIVSGIMASLNKLNFITGNKNKLAEVRAILGSVINVENQSVDVPEIQGTIEEIAKEKCRRAAEVVSSRLIEIYGSVFCISCVNTTGL